MGKSQWVNFRMPKLESNVTAHKTMEGQDPVTVWVAPTTASATDNDLVSRYPPHPHPRTLPLYTTNTFDENNKKTKISQTVITPSTEGIWTTMPRTRATRQIDDRYAKTLDNSKLKLTVNIYTCLIQKDQIANDRENIMICSRLLWNLHPHFVRKTIAIKYEGHPTSALDKGKVGFYLTRINQRRKMDPANNTKYPTRVLDKGEIGLKQRRIVIRHKSWLNQKGGERNVVYNIKVSNPHPSPLIVENLLDTLNQIHPLTTLSDVHHDNTRPRHKRCAKCKCEHDAKNGKHQKLHDKRKSEQETQAGTDK